jgi:hypothetical protein
MVGGLYGVRLLRKNALTGIVDQSHSLDGRPFVELAMESSTLKLAMLTASNVATVVHVRRPNGTAVANISIPAGSRRAALNLHGISGVVVVSILREKALIQATRITITR